jgi:succinate-semialdehyde dehydrogenase/glutarate-semialdehyde dehydrogenase
MSFADQLNRPDLLRNASLIDGKWVQPNSRIRVENPFDNALLAEIPDVGLEGVNAAIDAAQAAFLSWKNVVPKERAKILTKWAALMLEHQEDLARIITAEQGKNIKESRTEVAYAATFLDWFAAQGQRADGDIIAATKSDHRITVLKQPIGVVGAITPWNFPAAMVTRKIAPAVAAGCTVVLKPAELTPLSAFALGALAQEAGLPAGVINIISGKASIIGKQLCEDPRVRKLSFTGSTEVGRILAAQCAPHIKKLALELGGNAPFIIFEDADIPLAIKGLMASKFRNNGQTCVCANRILVHEKVEAAVIEGLKKALSALKCGNGTDEACDLGPLINPEAKAKVEELLADAKANGATLHLGGNGHALGGTFFEPTLISGITPQMRIFREEIFGPVVSITRFTSEEEAVRIANDTEYGLAAYFFTNDYRRIWRVGEALEYGMVGANEGAISTEVAPFGGVKQSGTGREGSKYGIEEYLEKKYLCWGDVK